MDIRLIAFLCTWAVLGAVGFWWLYNNSTRVHAGLFAIRQQALEARTRDQLIALKQRLIEYAATECWHRRYAEHAQAVMAYIDGRLAATR